MAGNRAVNRSTGAQGICRLMFARLSGAIILIVVPGCFGSGVFVSTYEIQGALLDAETAEVLAEAPLELTVEAGERVFDFGAFMTDPQGGFQASVITSLAEGVIAWPVIPVAMAEPAPAPIPDRVILLIGEGDDQVEVVIELTEEMIGELDESGSRAIELGTILVPSGG